MPSDQINYAFQAVGRCISSCATLFVRRNFLVSITRWLIACVLFFAGSKHHHHHLMDSWMQREGNFFREPLSAEAVRTGCVCNWLIGPALALRIRFCKARMGLFADETDARCLLSCLWRGCRNFDTRAEVGAGEKKRVAHNHTRLKPRNWYFCDKFVAMAYFLSQNVPDYFWDGDGNPFGSLYLYFSTSSKERVWPLLLFCNLLNFYPKELFLIFSIHFV